MNKQDEARASLEAATQDLKSYTDGVIQTSERISKLSTASLYGVLGGVVGMLVGGFIPVTQFASQPGIIAMFGLAGITAGVLYYRSGFKGIKTEQKVVSNRLISEELMHRIDVATKANAPQSIILSMWDEYERLALSLQDTPKAPQVKIGGATGAALYIESNNPQERDLNLDK